MAYTPGHDHNYGPAREATVSVQIQLQLEDASFICFSVAVCCDRLDVALNHLSRLFLHCFDQWRELAVRLAVLHNRRGRRADRLRLGRLEGASSRRRRRRA